MNVVVNPNYEYLRDWIEQIPSFFESSGNIIYKGRNILKVFAVDTDTSINVKRYRKPHFVNRIVYSFFRKSKACRAYHNTLLIAQKGFDTAESIAYIEIKRHMLLSDSYFISKQCPDVKEIRVCYDGPLTGNERLIEAFARYSASLHEAGIYHLDYSPGNILFREENGQYTFILIDVNRMKFMPVNFDTGCRNFARLFTDDDIYKHIAMVYSQSRENSFSQEGTVRLMLKYKNDFLQWKARKNRLKKLFWH